MGKIKHGSIVEIGDNLFIVLSILDKTSLLAKLTRTNTNDTNKYFSAHDIKNTSKDAYEKIKEGDYRIDSVIRVFKHQGVKQDSDISLQNLSIEDNQNLNVVNRINFDAFYYILWIFKASNLHENYASYFANIKLDKINQKSYLNE